MPSQFYSNYQMTPGMNGYQQPAYNQSYQQMQYAQNEQRVTDMAANENRAKEAYVEQLANQVRQRAEAPKIKTEPRQSLFTIKDAPKQQPSSGGLTLQNPDTQLIADTGGKKPRKRKKKEETVSSGEIVKAESGEVVDNNSTIQTYQYTSRLLGETLEQVDMVASEIKEEMDNIRLSRTMKGKYTYLTNLTDNLATLLNTKASVIKEINNTITKSNELDYRREKDRKDAEGNANDDKYIMDMYNAFIKNTSSGYTPNLGPTPVQTAMPGNNIVMAETPSYYVDNQGNNQPIEPGYVNYLNNLTPEQNSMFYENDPNVKTVVLYDAATGERSFQVMNIATGKIVPNVTTLDNRFLADTTLDLKSRIAKNNNLRESFPIVFKNEAVLDQY